MTNTFIYSSNRSAQTSWMRVSLAATMFAFSALLAGAANAGVDVTKITRGDVSFSQDGNRLVVRASNGSIIEYNRFSVEAGQIMQFIQPGASSRVLNRVTGSELSRIDGSLLSNGIVYLVNPQGIRIGNGALINVGGFYAAAGAMSDNDFIRGSNNFTNLSGKVINEGMIQAQSVALVGQYVANRGTINVDDGMVAMAAGDTVFLQNGPSPFMVTVNRSAMGADGSGAGTEAAVTNTGTINAGKGRVSMGSGDFYALGMNLSGTIIGKSIAARSGKGSVLAVNGTLDASDSAGKGGDIDVFGDRVGLFGNALVNANGATGGGSVRIGGDYLGSNAENAPQANRTVIGTDARITANATQGGDGGRVIVWSNEYTGFYGSIEANGAGVGNGGFVETSSHDNLQAFGSVTASSVLGAAGTWLMDPSDVTINLSTSGGAFDSNSPNTFTPTANSATASATTISQSLSGGTSVIIETASAQAQAGNITLANAINMTGGSNATLTLNAAGNIVLNASIAATPGNNLSVVLNATTGVTFNAAITTRGGSLTVLNLGAGAVNQTAGALTIGGTTSIITGAAAISLTNTANDFTGAVTLANTGANAVSIRDTNALVLGAVSMTAISGGSLTVTSVGLTQSGATIITTGTGGATMNAGAGLITLTNANEFNGAVSLNNSGLNNVAITDANALVFGASSVGVGTLTVIASTAITQSGAITQTVGAGAASFTTGAAAITLTNAANDFKGAVSLTNTGANAVSIRDTNALVLGAVSMTAISGGSLTVTSVGLTQSGATIITTGTGGATMNAGAGLITLTNANEFNGAVSLNNSGLNNVAITDVNALVFGASIVGTGTLTVNAGGAITQTGGAITQALSAGDASFTTGAAAITLTQTTNNFSGAVSLSNTGAFNVTIVDTNALVLGTSTVGQNLAVTTGAGGATGGLTQTGALTVAGTTNITSSAASTDIDLSTSPNNLTGAVTLTTPTNVRDFKLRNTNGGASAVTNLTNAGTTNLRDLTIIYNNVAYAVPTLTMASLRNIAITAGGAITQAAGGINNSITGGTASFTTGAAAITLTQTTNNFSGAVSLSNTGAFDVTIVDTNALVLGTSTVGQNLAVTTGAGVATGGLTQTGALTVAGTTNITSSAASTDIDLSTSANSLAGAVTLTTPGNVQDFKLRNINAAAGAVVNLSNAGTANLRDLTISYNNAAYVVPTLTMASLRNIDITAGGAITQAIGGIDNSNTGGTSRFTTGGFAITLTNNNDFGGEVFLSNTGLLNSVQIKDAFDLVLGASNIGGSLEVQTGSSGIFGNLSQTGVLIVGGTTTINTGANGGSIDLSTSANDLAGAVTLLNPDHILDFKLHNANSNAGAIINLDNSPTGTINLRDLTIVYDEASYVVPQLTMSTLNDVFIAACPNITLDTITTLGNLTLESCGSVTIVPLSVVTVGGNLQITAAMEDSNTPISQDSTSQLTVAGISQFTTLLGGNIQLLGTANAFAGSVGLSNGTGGGSIEIVTAASLILSGVEMSSILTLDTLKITAGGDITQIGRILSGTGSVAIENTFGTNIILDFSTNDFRGAVTLKNFNGGGDISIADSSGLLLESVEMNAVASGALTIMASVSADDTTGITQAAGGTIITGTGNVTIEVLKVVGPPSFSGAPITLNNASNDFNGVVTITNTGAHNVAITNGSGNGLLTLAAVTVGRNFTATADSIRLESAIRNTSAFPDGNNGGSITLTANTGALTIISGANIDSDGEVFLIAAGGIFTEGNVTTTNDTVTFASETTLNDSISISTGALLGDIVFSDTLQGAASGLQDLTLTAGTGNIEFDNAVGTLSINLGVITIVSAKDVTANSSIFAGSFTQSAGTGTSTFQGAQTYSAPIIGLTVTTFDIVLNGAVNTSGAALGGVVTLNASNNLNIGAGGDISSDGAVSLTGGNQITTFGTVSTLNGSVTLTAGTQGMTLNTGADIIAVGSVLLTSTPAGSITTDGAITTTSGGTVIMNTSGLLEIQSNADINSDGLVRFTGGGGIHTAGDVTTTADNVNYLSPTTLTGNVAIDTSAGIGSISFSNTLNGTFDLSLSAGTGDISFSLNVGGLTALTSLGAVTVNSATTTSAQGTFRAETLNLVSPGTTIFNDNLNVTTAMTTAVGAYQISILGLNNTIAGNTSFLNTGQLIIGAILGSSTFSGGITATDPLILTLSGSLMSTVDGADMNLGAASVLLAATTILTTNNGDITLGGTLNASGAGTRNLTLTAGTGDINFAGVVGATPISAIRIISARNVTASTITAASFTQLDGTGTTTLNGPQIYNLTAGLNVTTTTIALNNTVNTLSGLTGGIVTLSASDTLTITAGANITSDGAVTLTGTNGIRTAGNVTTTNDTITFTTALPSATTLTGSVVLNTGLGIGNVAFEGDLTGNGLAGLDLTLTAGTGSILFNGDVNLLQTVTINSASSTTASGAFSAGSLTLVAPGSTSIAGNLTLTTSLTVLAGIYNVSISGATNSVAGNTVFNNTGNLTIGQALGTTTFLGGVTAAIAPAPSSITLNGTIQTTSSNINFANAGTGILLGSNVTLSTPGLVSINVVAGATHNLSISAADLALGGNISNIPVLTIQNILPAGNITLNGAGGLAISQAEWNRIQPTVSSVVLGNTTDNIGAITVAVAGWINNSAVTVDFLSGGAGEFNVDGDITGTGSVTVNGSGNSTNINANMTQASFNILDSVVVGGGAGTRTLTATGLGGVVINSTGFVNGISATAAATSLALLTTFATAPISVTGTFTAIGGSALTGLTMGGSGVDASTITLAASGTILGALSLNNASGINLNSNSGTLTAASMFFGENATLTEDSALQALTSISTNAISGTASMFDLNIAAASLVLGGNITNVDTLTIQNISSSGDITLMGAGGLAFETQAEWNFIQPSVNLIVLGSTLHTGATTVDSAWTNNSAVRADFLSGGAGKFNINGVVTGTGNLTVNGSGISTNINANATQGFFIFNDPVVVGGGAGTRTLTATAGDVLFNGTLVGSNGGENLTVIASNSVQFNDIVGGTTTATQLGTLTVDCGNAIGNTITFANAAATVRAVDVKLNTNTLLTTPATVATIVARGDISFSNNTFEMGQNEKLTSLGNIRMNGLTGLNSNATSVTFGDVNAVGNLRVNSAAITLLARAPGPIVTNTGGTITDLRVDYVVGGQVFFSVAPVMGGSGGKAIFSNPTNNVDGSGTLSNYAKSLYPRTITAALLTGVGGQVLDLSAYSGLFKYGNPANIIPQAMASLPPVGLLGDSETLDSEEATALKAKKAKKDANTAAAKAKKSASTKPAKAAPVPVASR